MTAVVALLLSALFGGADQRFGSLDRFDPWVKPVLVTGRPRS